MSKDKSHKKDKSKEHDLFSLMLEQSEVFRDMVAQFQSAWAPKTFSSKHDEGAKTPPAPEKVISKKPVRATKPVEKLAAKVAPTAKKPATSTKNNVVKKAAGAKNSKPVVAKKSVVKAVQHSTKKSSPKR